jgi:hypothetical protein
MRRSIGNGLRLGSYDFVMPDPSTLDQARAAKGRVLEVFGKVAPVVGVGITRIGDGYGVKVNLESLPGDQSLPDAIDGVPVRIEVVGTIKKR